MKKLVFVVLMAKTIILAAWLASRYLLPTGKNRH